VTVVKTALDFNLFPVDDERRLFISPAIRDWSHLDQAGVRVVIDLEGGIDHGVPVLPNHTLYLYFPIFDENLPDLDRLHGIAQLGARLVKSGQPVLSHCGAGFNRSALVAGLILVELGWSGSKALSRLRERRPGALFNDTFAAYLGSK
jgi:hypothetical protein